jgi:error-prone DNA polymerase
MGRREASWQVARAARPTGPLFHDQPGQAGSPLRPMTPLEDTVADFQTTGLTVGAHPMAFARRALRRQGVLTCAELDNVPSGRDVRYAGSVIVRQRPGTAKGMLFITLEDETGMAQSIVDPDLLAKRRTVIVGAAGLVIEGTLQRRDGSATVKARDIWPINELADEPVRMASHDWH